MPRLSETLGATASTARAALDTLKDVLFVALLGAALVAVVQHVFHRVLDALTPTVPLASVRASATAAAAGPDTAEPPALDEHEHDDVLLTAPDADAAEGERDPPFAASGHARVLARLQARAAAFARQRPALVKNVAVLASALLLALFFWSVGLGGGGGGSVAGDEDETGIGGALTTAAVTKLHDVRYYLPRTRTTARGDPVPYIACQHHPAVGALHASELGERHAGDAAVARARELCVLEAARLLRVDDSANRQTRHALHLERPMLWELPARERQPRWYDDALVDRVFVTEAGERYYRVYAIARDTESAPHGLRPVVVAERELLAALERYAREMAIEARVENLRPDDPCLCPEYFGILGSGLQFVHDTEADTWEIVLDATVTRNLTTPHAPVKLARYSDKLGFPYRVNRSLGAHPADYYGRVNVKYVSLDALATAWQPRAQNTNLAVRPDDAAGLALVLHVETALANKAIAAEAQVESAFSGKKNDCLQHCLAVAQRIEAAYARDHAEEVATI